MTMCKSGCCGTLYYAATCPLCRVLARVVKWLDFAGGVTLQPLRSPGTPLFVRRLPLAGGVVVVRDHPGRWVAPGLVEELLHIRNLPQPVREVLAGLYDALLAPAYDVLDRLHDRVAPHPPSLASPKVF